MLFSATFPHIWVKTMNLRIHTQKKYISIPIYTYLYLYLFIPIYTYLYLSIPIYTYLRITAWSCLEDRSRIFFCVLRLVHSTLFRRTLRFPRFWPKFDMRSIWSQILLFFSVFSILFFLSATLTLSDRFVCRPS